LVLFDEIGRGTSTYDGVSIAWAVVEYLHEHPALCPKTLFATHYHELTQLAGRLPRVRNLTMRVEERGDQIVFLRKVVEGSADRSYGIQVARMAGLPDSLLARSREVLETLEQGEARSRKIGARKPKLQVHPGQLSIFSGGDAVCRELAKLDINNLTPLQALSVLIELQRKARTAV